ncbi:uncharacterized protein LOC128673215 isoform X1 [Plodia interpunctella]|uniref:uncharacterized protein LOC128673215 isoform X1 n=1 Tax=Plodia interpunctella TaxID=58824 RepID=UPI0023678AA0|nr:uncharacterized protein LOC128673215 isoform X1 [Plodia interpunctella]
MSESESSDPDRGTAADAGNLDNADAGDAAALLRLLRGLASGMQPAAPALIKFDPDDKDADIEDWCRINEVIVKAKNLQGTDLLLPLMRALRGRAATCLTKIQPECINWGNVKDTLIAKFSKPMLSQDYFDRVIKFKMHDKETAADAALRLWHLIETIPKVEFNDEVITGFAVSILSNHDHSLRRELNSHTITSKTQLFRILRGISMKRHSDDITSYTDSKRPRLNLRPTTSTFHGTCHRCGETGHKIYNCPQTRNSQPKPPAPRSTPTTSSVPPIHREEKRPVTCYACGEQGHIASVCTAAADLRETNRVPRKEVKLCAKRVATGELHIAEEESPEDVRTSGRPCRREY